VITRARRAPPERDAEASTTAQIKWAGAWPRGRRPSLPAEGSPMPAVGVGQENNAGIEIYYGELTRHPVR
jgi:hypothetical protein